MHLNQQQNGSSCFHCCPADTKRHSVDPRCRNVKPYLVDVGFICRPSTREHKVQLLPHCITGTSARWMEICSGKPGIFKPAPDGIANYFHGSRVKPLFRPHITIMESNKRRDFAFASGKKEKAQRDQPCQKLLFAKKYQEMHKWAAHSENQQHDCFLGIPYC